MVLELSGTSLFTQTDVRETAVSEESSISLKGFCNLKLAGSFTSTSNTWTPILFNSELSDDDNMHSLVVDTERINIYEDGIYVIIFTATDDSGPSYTDVRCIKNATTIFQAARFDSAPQNNSYTLVESLVTGDFIYWEIYANGATASVTSTSRFTVLKIK